MPVLVVVVASFFVFPWLPEPSPAGAALERYSPEQDGGSFLVENFDAEGRLVSTESQNLAVVPDLRSFTESREAIKDELEEIYGSPEEMGDAQVVEVRRRTLEESGEVSNATDTLVLDSRGLQLLGSREGETGTDLVFDRPVVLLPADLGPGKRWSSEGRAGSLNYELDGRVTGAGDFGGELGEFDDCLHVRTRLTISGEDRTAFEDTYCAGVGLVESRRFDGSGGLVLRSAVVSTDLAPTKYAAGLRPPTLTPGGEMPDDPASWHLAPFGRIRPTGEPTSSTIPPTYVPADPPVVLAAAQDGDLVALGAGENPGTVRWRFHPGGTIYGPPAFEPRMGRIYFGTTDKRLYALDARGLFLWAVKTGDNVASRPVVAGDTVVFGAEDRYVYGLDAGTGEERWRVKTGGPVVSSPAFAEGVVVIGSDDGAVYGLDPSTGDERWRYLANGPVEAPVTTAGGVAYVASRSGELTALEAGTGKEIWTSPKGEILRTAPAVGEGEIFVVDEAFGLLAFDRETGKKRREIPEGSFVGAPLVVGDALVVARNDGRLERVGLDGERGRVWNGAAASNPVDGDPTFSIGPTAGGGAVWAATDRAAVYRLGRETGPARIEPTWADAFSAPPFFGDAMQNTAAGYRGEALLLGQGNSVYLLDAGSGEARKAGELDAANGSPRGEPVVAGDTLLVASGDTLHAARMPDVDELWEFEGGSSQRPPVVAGRKVLWPSTSENALSALDLETGGTLWKASLPGAGGVLVRGKAAYANPASAFDLDTGRPLWRAETEGPASGGPALGASGRVLFAASGAGRAGSVAAFDVRDGEESWRAGLGGDAVKPSDRLWVSDNVVIAPLQSGDIVALDAESGGELWRYEPPYPRLGNITVEGKNVWLALQNGEILALDAGSGETVARSNDYSLNLYGTSLDQRPALVGGTLVLGVGTYVLGFEPKGGTGGP